MCIDGEMETKGIKLSKFPIAGIYFPEDSYYSSYPLPPELMEAFIDSPRKLEIQHDNETQYTYDASLNIDKIIRDTTKKRDLSLYNRSRADSVSTPSFPKVNTSNSGFFAKTQFKLMRPASTARNTQSNLFKPILDSKNDTAGKMGNTTGLSKNEDTSCISRTNILQKYIVNSDAIPEKANIGSRNENIRIKRRHKSHNTLSIKRLLSTKSKAEIKKLKKNKEYKKFPRGWLYMESPYGDTLKAGTELIELRHKRAKSEVRNIKKLS